jgi:hypothetical protein
MAIGSEPTAMTELCWWVQEWLQLDPALHIGPAALLGAADELARLDAKTELSLDAARAAHRRGT